MKFPPSCTVYGDAAMAAQRAHLWLVRIQLSLVVIGSAVAATMAFGPTLIPATVGFPVIVALFGSGIVVQLISSKQQLEKKWYSFRAVRESQKSLVWQYAMGLGDFGAYNQDALTLYLTRIRETEREFDFALVVIEDQPREEESFLTQLTESRRAGWAERKSSYLSGRVENQIRWYGSRATSNKRMASILDTTVVGLQVSGISLSVALLELHINGAAFLAFVSAAIASLVAWGQAKQYSALVGPYSNAQSELRSIRQFIMNAPTEPEFLRAASQAEEAISREHSLWCARKGLQRPQGR